MKLLLATAIAFSIGMTSTYLVLKKDEISNPIRPVASLEIPQVRNNEKIAPRNNYSDKVKLNAIERRNSKELAEKDVSGSNLTVENATKIPSTLPTDSIQSAIDVYSTLDVHEVQDQFESLLKSDTTLKKLASINSIECKDGACELRIKQNPKDNAEIQHSMFAFFSEHQEYGKYMKFDMVDGDPSTMVYTFTKDEK